MRRGARRRTAPSPGKGISQRFCRFRSCKHSQTSCARPISSAGATRTNRVWMENNMASFPDLRPSARLANAKGVAVLRRRSLHLLAVSAALLLTAFFAVSELATLHGAKAHDASAYLSRELGSPLSPAPLVRAPARGTTVALSADGFRVRHGQHALSLRLTGLSSGKLASYRRGISAPTSFGRVVVSATPTKTEQFLVVDDHHGTKTWRWQLEAHGLRPRIGDDGYVGFLSGHRLADDFTIAPPKILDRDGHDVSPRALHWSLAHTGARWRLELTLDDRNLPTPYIVDPASFNIAAGTTGPTAAGASLQLSLPAGIKVNDLLVAHVSWLGGSNITASGPAGGTWTQLDQTRNQGTVVGAQVWYRVATSADTSAGSYTWGFSPTAIGTGGIAAYSGVDLSATPQVAQLITAPTADANVYYPSITPSANNAQVISVVAHAKASSGTRLTPPLAVNGAAGAAGTNTDRWETANSGGIASELSDFTQATAAAVATNGVNTYPGGSGNNVAHVAFRIALKGDNTAPTSALSLSSVSPAGSAYYPGSGTTVWYRGTGPNCAAETQVAAKCSFKITNTESDSGSGPASSQFGTLGGTSTGWTFTGSTVTTPTGGPYVSNFFAFSSGASTSPTEQVTSADNGANSGSQTLTLTNDITGPTVPTPTVTAGYFTSTSVPVGLGAVSDNGGGSGVNAASVVVQRDAIGLTNGACGVFTGSWSTITLSGGNDTTVVSGNCYRYRENASDNVGNSTSSSASSTAKVDTSAPSTPTLSFTNLSSNAYYDGAGTLWIRPSAGGTFTVTGASTDADSTVASYTFGTLNSNGGANFGGSQTADHFDYTFGATTTAPTTGRTVNSTNGAGTTSSNASYSINADTTGPSVPAPTVTAGYYTSLSVPVSLGSVTDPGGSGPKASTFVVQRDAIGLSNGTCGVFTGSWSTVTLSGGNDTTVVSGNCYRYRENASDNVGNPTSSGASSTAKVDTSGPSTPTLAFSNLSSNAYYDGAGTLWIRPSASGTFTVTGASTDADSTVASYTFGTLNSNGGANFGGSQIADHFDYTFGATTTAPTTGRTVNSTNGAATNSSNASYTLNADTTGPSVPAPTVTAGYFTSLSVPVSLGAVTAPGGSGPKAATFVVQRDAIALSNGSCGVFTGSWSTVTLSGGNDTTVTSGNCYRYREVAADNVGNSTTGGTSNTAKVDTSAPSTPSLSFSNLSSNAFYDGAGTLWIRPSAGGTFTVTAASNDSESAISSYTFGTLNSNGGANFGGSQTVDHFDYTFGSTTTAPTTSRSVNSTNGAGPSSSNAPYTLTADTTGPSVPAPTVTAGYYTTLSVGVSLGSVTDTGGSGPKASTFVVQRDAIALSNGSCGVFTGSWSTVTLSGGNDTTVTSGNCYRYRENASDNVSNPTTSGASNTAKVDTSAPSTPALAFSNLSSNAYYDGAGTLWIRPFAGGTFTVTGSSTDGESTVASYTFGALNSNGGSNFGGSPTRDHLHHTFRAA